MLGFLKDNGLNEAYRTVCWEAGVDASVVSDGLQLHQRVVECMQSPVSRNREGEGAETLAREGFASQEELAPHVSLMRILLDWKRAFEARFQGTPRIIQPVHKPEPTVSGSV